MSTNKRLNLLRLNQLDDKQESKERYQLRYFCYLAYIKACTPHFEGY